MPDPGPDRVLRAMTDDGAFRVMAVRSTATAQGVITAQAVAGHTGATLGEVVTAAVLVRETMAPGNRVQVILRDALGSQLVGDAHPDGRTRGLARVLDPVLGVRVGDGSLLQVVRVVRAGRQQEGVVEAREEGGVAQALVHYFQQSEQITTMVDLACEVEDQTVRAAGGFVVQLLPEVTSPPLRSLTERLRTLEALGPRLLRTDADPEAMLGELLEGFLHTRLAESPVHFGCTCDEDTAVGALSTLGRAEIQELLDAGETLPVTCDYCRTRYEMGPAHFRRILDAAP
jgi:molecular chaperone Hsp33